MTTDRSLILTNLDFSNAECFSWWQMQAGGFQRELSASTNIGSCGFSKGLWEKKYIYINLFESCCILHVIMYTYCIWWRVTCDDRSTPSAPAGYRYDKVISAVLRYRTFLLKPTAWLSRGHLSELQDPAFLWGEGQSKRPFPASCAECNPQCGSRRGVSTNTSGNEEIKSRSTRIAVLNHPNGFAKLWHARFPVLQ